MFNVLSLLVDNIVEGGRGLPIYLVMPLGLVLKIPRQLYFRYLIQVCYGTCLGRPFRYLF